MVSLIEESKFLGVDLINLTSVGETRIYGILCIIKEMLSSTEVFGVGEQKAHNSLITTSMVKVKIWNNASYGDDVIKCY